MRCLTPILVQNPKRRDFVPCGKCNFCLEQKRGDWSFRLNQENHHARTSIFLTLTYEDESLPLAPDGRANLSKRHVQLFTKSVRKENARVCRWPLRYYTVGEYGELFSRAHYHVLMFNIHNRVAAKLDSFWPHGFIKLGEVNPASIHYVTKYLINREGDYSGRAPPFALMSRRPGIGHQYLRTHTKWHQDDKRNFTKINGIVSRLPRYYKEKMFSQATREQLAQDAIFASDKSYYDQIQRIAKYNPDPFHDYDQRVLQAHDKITSKIKFNAEPISADRGEKTSTQQIQSES